VPRQQLDDAQARFDADEHRVAGLEQAYALSAIGPRQEEIQRARGALTQAEGQLAYAEVQLAAVKIRAPIAGTILERTAEVGELVTSTFASRVAGGPIGSVVSLADLTDLQVELDVAQNEFASLHPHQRAVVTTDAFPDRQYPGILEEISPEANRQKATVQVKVAIENPDSHLRPDMNATVRFLSDAPSPGPPDTGIVVPGSAVRADGARRYVLVVSQDRAVAREVRVVTIRGDRVVVDGLNGGEHVIVNPPDAIKDASRIRRKP
jgi:HlyD family secretion protein